MIQRGVTAIPKSVNKERIEENINIFDFEISLQNMEAIKVLDTNASLFFSHSNPAVVKMIRGMKVDI